MHEVMITTTYFHYKRGNIMAIISGCNLELNAQDPVRKRTTRCFYLSATNWTYIKFDVL